MTFRVPGPQILMDVFRESAELGASDEMSQDDNLLEFQQDHGDPDEIEILEVIGIDEDPSEEPPRSAREPTEDEDPDEIVLALDDDDAAETRSDSGRLADDFAASQEQLLRLQADYDNLRKRVERERRDHLEFANSALVGRLLPVLDNFERALSSRPTESGDRMLFDGTVMIYKQLVDELRREGLLAVESVGQTFDPSIHDAVATDPDSDAPHNTVLEELQRGYVFRDRLLRPAMVKVSLSGVVTIRVEPDDEDT